jgi:outer membrane protein assembly factor BamB
MIRKPPLSMLALLGLLLLAACSVSPGHAGPLATSAPTPAPHTLNVYVSTNAKSSQNAVYALSGTSGKPLWNDASETSGNNPPVLAQGVIYVGSGNALKALNAQDGKLLWSYQAPGAVRVLGVVDGVVYGAADGLASGASSGDSSLFALKASTGSVRWNYPVVDVLDGNEMLADGGIYAMVQSKQPCHCSGQPGYALALNGGDGSVRWKTAQASDIYEMRFAANGLVYGIDGMTDEFTDSLLVRKASDGSVAWQFPQASAPAYVNVIGVDGNVIYILSNDGNSGFPPLSSGLNVVYALKASDGSVIWRSQITDMTPTIPTLINQVIYLGSSDGLVSALNEADGKLLWQAQLGQPSSPIGSGTTITAVVDGTVYLTFSQGFSALNASDGSVKWKYQVDGVKSITTVTNGVVYAWTSPLDQTNAGQNAIYALKAGDGSLLWSYDAPLAFNPPVVG